jgi:hypothetical protein
VRRLGIAPPSLRYKFWKLCESVVTAHLARRGVRYLPPPPATLRPDGFRHPDYWGTDWIHGTHDYGERVLEQIDLLLAGAAAAPRAAHGR